MMEDIRKIAVFRALQLGDLLCSIPAVRSIRRTFPDSHIDLIGLPWASNFVARFAHYFDGFAEFPGYPGLPERTANAQSVIAFLQEMQARTYDLVLQVHGNGSVVNPLVVLFASKVTAGMYKPGNFCPNPDTFIPYPEDKPEIHRLLTLTRHLGFETVGDDLEFPVTNVDRNEFEEVFKNRLDHNQYICLHPGARASGRRAPIHYFAQVGDLLAAAGYTVVITGVAEENPLAEQIAQAMKYRPLMATGHTSLGALAALLQNARLLIASDTSVSHVAAALKTPSIILFTESDPARWAPLDGTLHRVVTGSTGQGLDRLIATTKDMIPNLLVPLKAVHL